MLLWHWVPIRKTQVEGHSGPLAAISYHAGGWGGRLCCSIFIWVCFSEESLASVDEGWQKSLEQRTALRVHLLSEPRSLKAQPQTPTLDLELLLSLQRRANPHTLLLVVRELWESGKLWE